MGIVGLGSLSALFYGVANFFGGVAARRQPPSRVTAFSFLASALVVVPALAIGPAVWSPDALVTGAIAGVLGSVSVLLLYSALALGPIGFVAPSVALITMLLPTGWAIWQGESVTPQLAGALCVAIMAGVLLGGESDAALRPSRLAVVLTIVAGLADGGYMIAFSESPRNSGTVPAVADMVVGVVVTLAITVLAARRGAARPPRLDARAAALIAATGVVQGVGTTFQVFALHRPGLAVVAALAGLYPVATVAMARIVLREKIHLGQGAGLVLALIAVVLLANSLT